MTTTAPTTLNNVDLAAVGGLAQHITEHPDAAHTTWASVVHWDGAFRSTAKVRDFEPIASDEPSTLGGGDSAPNPVEQLLGALGNCLAVGYAANASVAGISIERLDIKLDGDIDLRSFLGLADGHAGFSEIRAVVDLVTDADTEAEAALHARVAASSPVGHTLAAPVQLSITPV
jgi:uncharacterized OsmC-like protein